MFALPQSTKHKVNGIKLRFEEHGKQTVPIIDLFLTCNLSNDALDMFCPGLRDHLCRADDSGQLKLVRFPIITKVALSTHYTGRSFIYDYGMGDPQTSQLPFDDSTPTSNKTLLGCKFDTFVAVLNNDGLIDLFYRVCLPRMAEEELGFWLNLKKKTCWFILPAVGEERNDVDTDEEEPDDSIDRDDDNDDPATRAFIEAHAGGSGTADAAPADS